MSTHRARGTSSLPRRMLGIVRAPRDTLEAVAGAPRSAGVLAATFLVAVAATAPVLETDTGRLALLDQLERTSSAFGQRVDDAQYAALEDVSESGLAYAVVTALLSGPVLAVALSGILFGAFRAAADGAATYRQVLAVASHAGVILALRQVVAAPVVYARETLASPVTLSLFFRMLDEDSAPARVAGLVDLFVLWWVGVLAVGMSVLYHRPARRLAVIFVATYMLLAILLATAMMFTGGTA